MHSYSAQVCTVQDISRWQWETHGKKLGQILKFFANKMAGKAGESAHDEAARVVAASLGLTKEVMIKRLLELIENMSIGTCHKAECRLFKMADLRDGRVCDAQCSSGKDHQARLMGGVGHACNSTVEKYVAVYTLSGLKASFYDFQQGSRLPDLKQRKPKFTRVEDNIDDVYDTGLWGKHMKTNPAVADHMAAQWRGRIFIPRDGVYRFWLTSDDGSKLWIDGLPVVDNDGVHALRTRTGKVKLTKGPHLFKVEFFEVEQGKGVEVQWKIPGGKREIIPPGQFVPY